VSGKVYLVGAGPGDPDLLTIKALKTIKKAEVLVYDRLVNTALLKIPYESCERIDVGKSPNSHPVPQNEINQILYEKASQGKQVVRLKGGDPFVFGRGGEEALFLNNLGISVEVVPGITSAIAVPSYAGIPVTHRNISSSFHVFSGHERNSSSVDMDWEAISKLKGTLIFLMGFANLKGLVEKLIWLGKPIDTPVAIIANGATSKQKTVVGSLANIIAQTEQIGVTNPAVLIVGDVVRLRSHLNWFESKKFIGKRILFTGLIETEFFNHKHSYFDRLSEQGVDILFYPTIKITPLEDDLSDFLAELHQYQSLIFTSKNGINCFFNFLKKRKFDLRMLSGIQISVVGEKTALHLEKYGLFPNFVSPDNTSSGLLKIIQFQNPSQKVAVITSDIGGANFVSSLNQSGLQTKKIIAYQNQPNLSVERYILDEIEKRIDIIIFTSPSTYRALKKIAGDRWKFIQHAAIIAIGPTTADAIEKDGFFVDMVPEEHSISGIAQIIEKNLLTNEKPEKERI
jgi:uroporphyrinogen III methyltransferase/synthase